MHVGGAPTAASHDPLREQGDDLVEVLALESREGGGTTNQREEFVLVPVFGAAGRHDLLGENVEIMGTIVNPNAIYFYKFANS